jgi:hypothetical protein
VIRLAWLPGGVEKREIIVNLVKQPETLIRRGLVTDVVDGPGEVVDRHQVRTVPPRQQPQRNWKILCGSLVGQDIVARAGQCSPIRTISGSDLRSREQAARLMRRGCRLRPGPITSHDLYLRMAR